MKYFYQIMRSPLGKLKLVGSNNGLAGILWENDRAGRVPHLQNSIEHKTHPVLKETEKQLAEYFRNERKVFDIALDFTGTEFQKKVWQALLTIPYGETSSYGEIAKQIGSPSASRAVGAANGRNPISIIAPCHRVIGTNGKLTGFAGGLDAKTYLLQLETVDIFSIKQAS